ncbi:hypothetical protein DRN87_03650 [Candidatus Geothermarchaeota archaeon]|nr:MAG: hypothetical protein DRN87_03650 [Candidatus Geothermarchaeota archaeon]
MNEELDYILSVISNELRRKIIKIIGEEGPISYTKLMKRLDIKDSGTLGFHIKKMNKMLKRDDLGEYILNELGVKAYNLIKELERGEIKTIREARKARTLLIDDKLNFDYTREIAEKFRRDGVKVSFTDIINLNIHPMPTELFEDTVESIADCLNVKIPKELYPSVVAVSDDVLNISVYEGDISKHRSKVPGIPFLSTIISSIVNALSSLNLNWVFNVGMGKKRRRELIHEGELNLSDISRFNIELNGGAILVKSSDKGYIKVWKTGLREPEYDFKVSGDSASLYLMNGYIEIEIPRNINSLDVDISGGAIKADLMNIPKLNTAIFGGSGDFKIISEKPVEIYSNVDGGAIKYIIDLRKIEGGESKIVNKLSGGAARYHVTIPSNCKVKASREKIVGGYSIIKINGLNVKGVYKDMGYDESGCRMEVIDELDGGASVIEVRRE